MFLRVSLIERDRRAQRFLWRGADRDREADEYENTSLIFGSKSSPCSAIYIKNKNAERFVDVKPEAAQSIVTNSYMDDYLASGETVDEMKQRIRDVIAINREAEFHMHGWASNESRVVEDVCFENKLGKKDKANLCNEEERVLGLYWDRNEDTLSFNVGHGKIPSKLLLDDTKPTKREFFSVAMSVYDPLGIIAPFTVQSKFIMQNVWRSEVKWDSHILEDEFRAWQVWLKNLFEMKKCKIPRCYLDGSLKDSKIQLHIFCDASLRAYAAVAYLRSEIHGRTHLSLIMSKSRVSPKKPMTVPRLELQAALLGARIAVTITKELEFDFEARVFWSDSTTILQWLRTDAREKQMFVANRLAEIGELTKVDEWRWVPTKMNPADDATRESNKPMLSTDRWLVGPEFLLGHPDSWPNQKIIQKSEKREINELEARKEFIGTISIREPENCMVSLSIRILGWQRIRKTMERVRKCFYLWYRYQNPRRRNRRTLKHVSTLRVYDDSLETPVERAAEAEHVWYREIQSVCFPKEVETLRKGKDPPKGSKLMSFKPYLDDQGVLRAQGRVTKLEKKGRVKSKFEVLEFENRPIILDASHYATKLLIADFHKRYDHVNNQTVLNELRQHFYIVGLRTRLRWLAKHCVVCRLRRAKPENPPMSDLPESRLAYWQRPFTQCGIDYFGPMLIKIGRRREKRWGVLFTCMTTRAIHVELAHTLNASSTLMAIKRLASRIGFPREMYSDNGTNFIRANKDLKEAIAGIDYEKQLRFAEANKFQWHFNPPDAPHMGGAWERLIRSVKIALNNALKEQVPTGEVLLTLLVEIEHMVNSRPLTHVSVDPRDEEALTPNHFLIGSSSGHLHLAKYEAEVQNPRNAFETAQCLANGFWKRWIREYLPTLLPRQKWHAATQLIKVGDIVLIVDYQVPRNSWKVGKVVEVFPNKSDNVTRVVNVRAGKKVFTRPVCKLIKIFSP